MIHVALDSSIYTENPRLDSPEFKALAFLTKNDCIQLHIPFIVENEFKSQIEIVQRNRIESVLTTLDKMCKFPIIGPKTSNLIEVMNKLSESKDEIIGERGKNFLQWASDIKALRYEVTKKETIESLFAYFYGKPPLQKPKVRNDIPDSFIFQSLMNIHNINCLQVVVKDKKTQNSLRRSWNEMLYKSIKFYWE